MSQEAKEKLNQRLESIDKDINTQKKRLEETDNDIQGITASIKPVFGDAYLEKLVDDVEWKEASPENEKFKEKFLNHAFPAVCTLAKHHLTKCQVEEVIRSLQERRAALLKDVEHNDLLPCELYQMIQDLRRQMEVLRDENKVLRERIDVMEKPKFQFIPNPNIVWNPVAQSMSLNVAGHQSITSFNPLPNKKYSWSITLSGTIAWVMLGISSSSVNIPATNSYSHPTVYGWACSNQCYIAGVNTPSHGGWVGFTSNTTAVLTYDPDVGNVSLQYNGKDYVIITGKLPAAYIHCNLHTAGTVLTMT